MFENYRKTLAVIVPVYNTEKYLPQCIESLITQTEPFDEVLLIDDGSCDGSLDICKEYQSQYSNIFIYSHENAGISYSRNVGIAHCRSDYVLFVDSDDMLNVQAVKHIKEKLYETDYDMVLYDADVIYEKGFEQKGNPYDRSKWISEGEMSGKEFFQKMFPDCYTTVVYIAAYKKSQLLNNHIQFPVGVNYAEDTSFILQALLEADLVYYNRKKLYMRRRRENSIMTSAIDEKKVRDCFCVAKKLADIMLEYMRRDQDCKDRYIALVLFHYNAAVHLCRAFEQKNETKVFFETDVEDNFGKMFSFFENVQCIWSTENNISNIQMALRLIEKCQSYGNNANHTKAILQQNLNEHILRKLKLLPFGEKHITVILYGTGVATGVILSLYKERVGEIKSRIAFMKTEAAIGEKYMDLPVYSIKNMPIDAQYVIISSYKYKREMWEALKANNIQINIVDIYKNEYFEIMWPQIGGI